MWLRINRQAFEQLYQLAHSVHAMYKAVVFTALCVVAYSAAQEYATALSTDENVDLPTIEPSPGVNEVVTDENEVSESNSLVVKIV